MPKYSHNRVNKGFAFIEFEDEKGVTAALDYFEKIGQIIQVPPEELCSVKTFEAEAGEQVVENDGCEGTEENTKKRKIDDSDDVEENKEKKLKIDDVTKIDEGNGNVEKADVVKDEGTNDVEDAENKGENKRRRKNKRCQLKEMGLQILKKYR